MRESYQDIVNQAGLFVIIVAIFTVRTFSQFLIFNLVLYNSLEYLRQGEAAKAKFLMIQSQ